MATHRISLGKDELVAESGCGVCGSGQCSAGSGVYVFYGPGVYLVRSSCWGMGEI